jgi:hypothetical protein
VIRTGKRDKACSGSCGDVSNLGDSQSRQVAKMILGLARLLILTGFGDDLLQDGRLGVGVVLDVRPPARSKITFGALVEITLPRMRTRPVVARLSGDE